MKRRSEYVRASATIERGVAAGAAGILWMSSRVGGNLYRRADRADGRERLPGVIIAREDALRIARLIESGADVRARLRLTNHIGSSFEERNIVAEIRGREKPNEIVLLGAHLDSWDLGTGALDNGANCALVVEVARAFAAAGTRPRRTIRFVLFSGEEQGMYGSWAYARAHRAELDNFSAVVIFDHFTGRTTGFSLAGRPDIEPAVREVLAPIASWDVVHHDTEPVFDTDNFDFLLEGVPTLVALQNEEELMQHYHAATDTADKIDFRSLHMNAAIAATTVYGLSERDGRLGKRFARAEIEHVIRSSSLLQDMRDVGIWPMWERRERGRQE